MSPMDRQPEFDQSPGFNGAACQQVSGKSGHHFDAGTLL